MDNDKNEVGLVQNEEYAKNVVKLKRVSDMVMNVRLETEGVMMNVVSGYAP